MTLSFLPEFVKCCSATWTYRPHRTQRRAPRLMAVPGDPRPTRREGTRSADAEGGTTRAPREVSPFALVVSLGGSEEEPMRGRRVLNVRTDR